MTSAEIKVIFDVLVVTRDVTPIRYCSGPLDVPCGRSQLCIFTENGRSFDRPHAAFARALGSSLLDGRGLAVLVAILTRISCRFDVADDCSEAAAEVEGKVNKTHEQGFLYCSSGR